LKIELTANDLKLTGDTVVGGKPYHEETILSLDGKETVVGPASLAFKRIDDSAFDIVSKGTVGNANISELSHFSVSSDGGTLTETKTQTLRNGGPEGAVIRTSTSVLVFKKMP
jgi:hypothetical protein